MNSALLEARAFIPYWFNTRKLKLTANGMIIGIAERPFETLWLDYVEWFSIEASKVPKIDTQTGAKIKPPIRVPEKDLEKAFNEYLALQKAAMRDEALSGLEYAAADDSNVKVWLRAVTGTATDFQVAIIKHVLWQVKRKVLKRKVVYHLCPMFFGKQNGGKSTAVFSLFKPLEEFTIDFSPPHATDERNAKTLQDNFVCIFDEMAGMKRVEMEAFKRVITAETLTYRPLHTNRFEKVVQNTTFIGISNKALPENIYDPTGLRRFVEITCLDKLNWSELEAVDVPSIWHSIDENRPEGYILDVIDELRQHQEALVTEDEVQHFLREMDIPIMDGCVETEISAKLFHDAYVLWRSQNGYSSKPPLAPPFLGMRLSTHKIAKKVRRVEGKDVTFYKVNAASHLFNERSMKVVTSNLSFLQE